MYTSRLSYCVATVQGQIGLYGIWAEGRKFTEPWEHLTGDALLEWWASLTPERRWVLAVLGSSTCVLVVCCCSLYCCCSIWVQGSALLAQGPSQKTPSHRLYGEEPCQGGLQGKWTQSGSITGPNKQYSHNLENGPNKQYSHSLENGPTFPESCFVIQYLGILPSLCAFSTQGSQDFPAGRHMAFSVHGSLHP